MSMGSDELWLAALAIVLLLAFSKGFAVLIVVAAIITACLITAR